MVEMIVNGQVIRYVGDELATYTETIYMKDKFKELIGDGNARPNISVHEKVNGPSGTYSSISISAGLTLSCDQSSDSIQKGYDLAYDEVVAALDKRLPNSVKMLHRHLDLLDEINRDRD